jgi:hypothetical protein
MTWNTPGRAEWVTICDEGIKNYVRGEDEHGNEVWREGLGDRPGRVASAPFEMTAAEFRAAVEASLL